MLVAMGIGNPDRRDDRAGLVAARWLRRYSDVDVLVAGVSPEGYAGRIKALQPTTLLLIDAVHLGAALGTVRLLTADDLATRPAWNNHRPPLALLMRYLAAETGARVWLAGIQPADTGWGRRLTPAVRDIIRKELLAIVRGLA
ncbi:MAG TPA: hydrogenase maturation protease [Symbiobacteriaceae bacterium]|nr:hydrogenase maturation protease [Symbiobacteriaceae bacterium]